MKTKIISIVVMLLMACNVMAQDYMTVYFKDGTDRKFYLKDIATIATKKQDAEGKQHSDYEFQHITTHHSKYVYNLNEVDSITFSSIDEEAAERNFVAAMPEVFSAISDCNTIDDAEKLIDQINAIDGVGEARTDGHMLHVSIEEGETYSFQFDSDADISQDLSFDRVKAMIPRMKSMMESSGNTLKVALANQMAKDEDRHYMETDFYLPIINILNSCGFDAKYIPNPTIDFFYKKSDDTAPPSIYDYDVVILSTHGFYDNLLYYNKRKVVYGPKAHQIAVSNELFSRNAESEDSEDKPYWDENYKKFKNWLNETEYSEATDQHINYAFLKEERGGRWKWIAYPILTEFFFRDFAPGKFKDNSLLFNNACQSLKGNHEDESFSFAKILCEKKNLGIYMGYTETNISAPRAGAEFFENMCLGLSLEKSIDLLPDFCKEETKENFIAGGLNQNCIDKAENALLKVYPSNDYSYGRFLTSTKTLDLDEDKLNQEYLISGKVTVEGQTELTILPQHFNYGITVGFEYGYDPNNFRQFVLSNLVTLPSTKPYDFTFKATLEDLEPGSLFYYRAFTSDGKHHNYGDIKTINLKRNLNISQRSMTLTVGNKGVVSALNGSGVYSVSNYNPSVVEVTLSNNEVNVKALHPGSSIIIITDSNTGKSAGLTVDVISIGFYCSDDHHPHMIDLGLPSGTLWSCCNVGSKVPSEYGGFYSWGETEVKDKYDLGHYAYYNELRNNNNFSYIGYDISGTPYDAAHEQWGDYWQMPSKDQFQELLDNCTWTIVSQDAVTGYLVTGGNGASVFLPLGKNKSESSDNENDLFGGYWTSINALNDVSSNAWLLKMAHSDAPVLWETECYRGWSVRPIGLGLPATTLMLAHNSVELSVGNRATVDISSGSGNYTVSVDVPSVATATQSGSTITIEGVTPGTAVVTVKDNETQQMADIIVIVSSGDTSFQTETFTVNGVSFNMVAVEGGTFMMGASESDPDVFDGERPQHQVTLSSYSIGQTEVTQELWKAVMGDNPSNFTGSANLPVEQVSWYDCQEFITKLNKLTGRTFSLPTDAEWEFAARGGNRSKGYKYSGSNNIDNVAWYKDNSGNKTNVVATKSPNELGLYDMSGNVWEWCHDFYSKYSDEAQTNPIGNIPNDQRSMHGGSWNFNSSFCRVCHRNRDVADHTASHLGFRLALSSLEKPTTWNVSAEAIDLGLPSGTLWASCNVGASTPEEYGDYYSWGEVSTKDSYDWNTYKYYVYETGSAKNLGEDIAGTKYDVAHLKWGGLWRMPSKEQIQELIDNCTCTTRIQNGVEGVLVKGPNGKTIFLPYAGFMFLGAQTNADSRGYYWSSTQWYYSSSAFSLDIEYGVNDWALSYRERSIGYTVRPVMPDGNLRISKNSVDLNLGTGTTIEILTGSGNYSVSVDKPAIATASLSDNIITIDGVALGSAVVTLKDHDYGKTAEINVKVSSSSEEYPIAEAVDLGLFSGTLWASWNVGASAPEDCGGYYAWGETEAKDNYVRDSYEYYNSAFGRWIEIGDDIAGTEYDVAHVRWGGSWTMPTDEQIRELMDDCTREFTTRNGVSGYLITGRNGNSIFLPAAGYMSGDEKLYSNYEGRYWSSIQQALNHAAEVRFSDRSWNLYNSYKPYGLCVRAVITPAERPPLPLSCPDDNHPHVIDLGLPSGTKWACCNVGSTRPESSGGYYAWGESAMKDSYDWSNYVHCDGTEYTCHDIGRDIAGTEYDVAHVKWGGSWQMPSVDQFNEMLSYCSGSWTQHNGVDGVIVIGPNGNAIFLPAVGYVYGGYLYESESSGRYWASTRYPYSKAMAYNLKFSSSSWSYQNTSEVIYGFPVRPISP